MIEIKNISKIVGNGFKDYGGRYQYWFWIRNMNTKRESRLTLDRRDCTLTMDKVSGVVFTLNVGDVRSIRDFVGTVEKILNYYI
jgi:hypothetical protein